MDNEPTTVKVIFKKIVYQQRLIKDFATARQRGNISEENQKANQAT